MKFHVQYINLWSPAKNFQQFSYQKVSKYCNQDCSYTQLNSKFSEQDKVSL